MSEFRKVEEMFAQSIGLKEPWEIERAEFTEQDRAVHKYVTARKTAKYPCPVCGEMVVRHDNEEERIWQHGDVVFLSMLCPLSATTGKMREMWKDPCGNGAMGEGEIPIHIAIRSICHAVGRKAAIESSTKIFANQPYSLNPYSLVLGQETNRTRVYERCVRPMYR